MKQHIRRIVTGALVLALTLPLGAFAAQATTPQEAADALYNLGLFNGTGKDANGQPIYELERTPTRSEAVTMLVTLLGKSQEAQQQEWRIPFTDVAGWARPFVGYAYQNGLTAGTSATTYGGDESVTASQYLTFVLRALGYEVGTDFQWDQAWVLTDQLGITQGQYNAQTSFTRGDVALISYQALSAKLKGQDTTLLQTLPLSDIPGSNTPAAPQAVALTVDNVKDYLNLTASAAALVESNAFHQLGTGTVTVTTTPRMTARFDNVTIRFSLQTSSSNWGSMGTENGWDTITLSSDGWSSNVYNIYSFAGSYVDPFPTYRVVVQAVTGTVTVQ